MGINIIAFIITTLIAATGAAIALSQWKKNIAYQSTKFAHEVLSKFQHEEDVNDAFYFVTNLNKKYVRRDDRRKIDKLLMWMSYVCYLRETKRINDNEFSFIESSLHHVLNNDWIKIYLQLADEASHKINARCAFHYLITYGIEHTMLCKNDFHLTQFDS